MSFNVYLVVKSNKIALANLQFLGFLSVFTEAMLAAPQFYRNFINKSTKGMR